MKDRFNGPLCRMCGAKVRNHNPRATLCGDETCREIDRTGKTRDQIVFETSQIPIKPRSLFHTDSNRKQIRLPE